MTTDELIRALRDQTNTNGAGMMDAGTSANGC